MELKRDYCYGSCESCKNCKVKNIGGIIAMFTCKKSGRFVAWNNKCYLYRVKRRLVKGCDAKC